MNGEMITALENFMKANQSILLENQAIYHQMTDNTFYGIMAIGILVVLSVANFYVMIRMDKKNRLIEEAAQAKLILKVDLINSEQFKESFYHISNLIQIVDDLLPIDESAIKLRKSYIKAKEFVHSNIQQSVL